MADALVPGEALAVGESGFCSSQGGSSSAGLGGGGLQPPPVACCRGAGQGPGLAV